MPDSWTMTRLGNGWRYFRQLGLMPAIQMLINRYAYSSRQFFIIRGNLAGPPVPDHVDDVVLRLATEFDLEHLDHLERYGRGAIQRMYVEEEKDWLFVACHAQRVVATERASRVVRDALVCRIVQLRDGQVWSADAFCLPEYRSQRISRHLGLFGERFLAAQGYKEFLGSVRANNTPALRKSLHAGAKLESYVSYIRILFWERLRVSKDIPKHLFDDQK